MCTGCRPRKRHSGVRFDSAQLGLGYSLLLGNCGYFLWGGTVVCENDVDRPTDDFAWLLPNFELLGRSHDSLPVCSWRMPPELVYGRTSRSKYCRDLEKSKVVSIQILLILAATCYPKPPSSS